MAKFAKSPIVRIVVVILLSSGFIDGFKLVSLILNQIFALFLFNDYNLNIANFFVCATIDGHA